MHGRKKKIFIEHMAFRTSVRCSKAILNFLRRPSSNHTKFKHLQKNISAMADPLDLFGCRVKFLCGFALLLKSPPLRTAGS